MSQAIEDGLEAEPASEGDASMVDELFMGEVKSALKKEGCPLCRLGREAEDRYLFFFLHEHMNSLPIYEILAKGGRLCHHHSWLVFDRASRSTGLLGMAALYDHMTDLLVDELRRALERSTQKEKVHGMHSRRRSQRSRRGGESGAQDCWICRSIAGTEDTFLDYLCKGLENGAILRETYAESDGLCLPHLKAAFAQAPPSVGSFVLEKAVSDLGRLKSELREYQRKNDYRFHDEPWGEEKTSPERVVRLCVGPRDSPVSPRWVGVPKKTN